MYPADAERLVLYLTVGEDKAWGGLLSTVSMYEETLRLKHIHGAEAAICTVPGDPLLIKYTKFTNHNYVFSLSPLLDRMPNLRSLLVHVPECYIRQFITRTSPKDWRRLRAIPDLRFNILIGNIEVLDPLAAVRELQALGAVTCTTAHRAYSSLEVQQTLGCPVCELSTYVSPERYERRPYREKEDLLIVSHDRHPRKSQILGAIARRFPRVRIQVIQNLAYEEYKRCIARAKWCLTFGEGLDGYFVETIFSGGIAFAVYNTTFFTEDFQSLRTLYPSYERLGQQVCSDLAALDREQEYAAYQAIQHRLCAAYYNYDQYVHNVTSYYRRYFALEGSSP